MGSVQFLLKHNRSGSLTFSAIGSNTFSEMFPSGVKSTLPDSILYWDEGKLMVESDAILGITRELGFPWNLGLVFWILPRGIRNFFYRIIAKHRYQWFGKAESCMVPTQEIKIRFLD